MGIIEATIYGIIQGIAEFLPISSSGHLALAQNFFGTDTENGLAFNIVLHLATLFSVCVVFRKDVASLIIGFFSLIKKLFTGKLKQGLDKGEKMVIVLVAATVPLVFVKLLGFDELVETLTGISWIIGSLLIFNGIMLFVSDRLPKGEGAVENSGVIRPLGVGVVQAVLGVFPGISRSGSTITGARIFGYSREEAVRFSFLMSIPAILGACVVELPDLFGESFSADMVAPILAGAVTAAVVGFFAIKLLQYISKNKSFTFFAFYCIIVGVAAVIADIVL